MGTLTVASVVSADAIVTVVSTVRGMSNTALKVTPSPSPIVNADWLNDNVA